MEDRQVERFNSLVRNKIDPSSTQLISNLVSNIHLEQNYNSFVENSFNPEIREKAKSIFDFQRISDKEYLRERSRATLNYVKRKLAIQKVNEDGVDIEMLQDRQKELMDQSLSYFKFYNKALENLVEG